MEHGGSTHHFHHCCEAMILTQRFTGCLATHHKIATTPARHNIVEEIKRYACRGDVVYPSVTGEHHMSQDYATQFYKGKAWLKCRASYISKRIAIDGGMCEECKRTLGYIVHHKQEITPGNIKDSWITLNHENLAYVCVPCHNAIHMGMHSWGEFDEYGQPIPNKDEIG